MIKSYNYKDFKIEILYEDSYIAILNNFEISKTGVVIKPPKPIKIILLLDKNTKVTFNNNFRIKKNLFFDFKIILFILLLSIFPKYFFPISFVIKRILFGSLIRLKSLIYASAGKI